MNTNPPYIFRNIKPSQYDAIVRQNLIASMSKAPENGTLEKLLVDCVELMDLSKWSKK